jgi:hypothetical protein
MEILKLFPDDLIFEKERHETIAKLFISALTKLFCNYNFNDLK